MKVLEGCETVAGRFAGGLVAMLGADAIVRSGESGFPRRPAVTLSDRCLRQLEELDRVAGQDLVPQPLILNVTKAHFLLVA